MNIRILSVPLNQVDVRGEPTMPAGGLDKTIRELGMVGGVAATVVVNGDGGYRVVDGRHRVKALRSIHGEDSDRLVAVALLEGLDETQEAVATLVANIHRQPNPAVEAEKMKVLKEHNLTQEEISDLLGISRSQVSKRLKLLNLIPPLMVMLRDGSLKPSVARELCHLSTDEQRRVIGGRSDGARITLREAHEARRVSTVQSLPHIEATGTGGQELWLAQQIEHIADNIPESESVGKDTLYNAAGYLRGINHRQRLPPVDDLTLHIRGQNRRRRPSP